MAVRATIAAHDVPAMVVTVTAAVDAAIAAAIRSTAVFTASAPQLPFVRDATSPAGRDRKSVV